MKSFRWGLSILVAALVLQMFSIAEASAPKAYMDLEPGVFSGAASVYVNGQKLEPGFWSPGRYKLAEVMKDNPRAAEFAGKHEDYAKWGGISLFGGLGAAITYMVVAREDYQPTVYWGIFGVGLITSAFLQKASMAYLFKAINAYNGVDQVALSSFDFSVAPIKDGVGLGVSYRF